MSINQYNLKDFKKLKKAGEITSQTLDFLEDKIKPGITTNYIDKICVDFLKSKIIYIFLSNLISHFKIQLILNFYFYLKF